MTEAVVTNELPLATLPVEEQGRELVPFVSLDDRAASINRHIDLISKADASAARHRLRAGQELLEVRAILPHGEWLPWCKANIKRGARDVQKLLKIAGAADPAAAHAEENAQRREAAKAVKCATVAYLETPERVEVSAGIEHSAGRRRIKNTITVPKQVEGETTDQTTERLFLYLASGDLDLCNKIVRDLGLKSVESRASLNRMLNAAQDVMVAWEKVKLELAKKYHNLDAESEESDPVEVEAAPVEIEVVEVVAEPVVEPVAKCPMTDCEGGNRWETVDGVRQDLGPCGVCHPEAYAAEVVEVSAPTVIKPKGNKLSKHGAVTRLTVEQYEAAKRAEAETPKERADRRRRAKEAQKQEAA